MERQEAARSENTLSLKRPASSTDGPRKPRRRRVFSCESCQRLKCKCDYDLSLQTCRRCQTLRIHCSLRGGAKDVDSRQISSNDMQAIEKKIEQQDRALAELRNIIRDLVSSRQSLPTGKRHPDVRLKIVDDRDTSVENESDSGPENIPHPVDPATSAAPIVVLREISWHCKGRRRRALAKTSLDLVATQLIDESTAEELIQLFFQNHGYARMLRERASSQELRQTSTFLHSVCCLLGLIYRKDISGTPLHREVYERVRATLGQALLSSPLSLDEIYGVFLMSENATDPAGDEIEYIDSWLLTGYAAKQAMLGIEFSAIISNIKNGQSTIDDQNAIRLWSTICCQHLHWAATTSRPSVVQDAHINQCDAIMSFYEASIQDGMLLAEIHLFSALLQKLQAFPSSNTAVECDEFLSWKQKWSHILSLPTAAKLRISYYMANLIIAIRSLEELGEGLRSSTFLSDQPHPASGQSVSPSSSRSLLSLVASKYARLILQTFLDMPLFVKNTQSINTYLCIGYCAIIIAHYDESQSGIPDEQGLGLITAVENWSDNAPGKEWVVKFGKIARQKLLARISGGGRDDFDDFSTPSMETYGDYQSTQNTTVEVQEMSDTASPLLSPLHSAMRTGLSHPSMALLSIEEFFSGGFLDFPQRLDD